MEQAASDRGSTVSVIVPHLNQPAFLENCLSSLDAQTLPRDHFEVIVVDNGSTQVPVDLVAKHPGVRLVQEMEPGPGPARNRGVQEASGNIFAFVDADCRAHPDWLRAGVTKIEASTRHTILGGDVQIWRDDKQQFSATEAYESIFAYRFKLVGCLHLVEIARHVAGMERQRGLIDRDHGNRSTFNMRKSRFAATSTAGAPALLSSGRRRG